MCVLFHGMIRIESAYDRRDWPGRRHDVFVFFRVEWVQGSWYEIVVIIRDEVMNWINEFSLVILMKPIINQYKSYWYCYVEVGIMLDCVGRSLPYTLKFSIAREKLPYQKERGLPTIHFQGISLFKILEYITTWYLQLMYIRYLYLYCIFKKIYIYRKSNFHIKHVY